MKIRKAKREDIEEIFKLTKGNRELRYYKREGMSRKYLETIIKSIRGLTLVCEIENKIIGFLHADEFMRYFYLEELFVKNKFRRKGIGKMLLMELERQARKKKRQDISLFVDVNNKAAKKFYQNMKYVKGLDLTFYYKNVK